MFSKRRVKGPVNTVKGKGLLIYKAFSVKKKKKKNRQAKHFGEKFHANQTKNKKVTQVQIF